MVEDKLYLEEGYKNDEYVSDSEDYSWKDYLK